MSEGLTSEQLNLVKLLWELVQSRIDNLYSQEGAEEEKQAIEIIIKHALNDNDASELIRWNSPLAV